jgi:hypothetical protein
MASTNHCTDNPLFESRLLNHKKNNSNKVGIPPHSGTAIAHYSLIIQTQKNISLNILNNKRSNQ